MRATKYFIFSLVIIWSTYYAGKFISGSEKTFLFPSHPLLSILQKLPTDSRIAFFDDSSRIAPNMSSWYGVATIDGLNPVYAKRYGLFNSYVLHGDFGYVQRISVQFDARAIADPSNDIPRARMRKALSLLGASHIISRKNSWHDELYPISWENDDYQVRENHSALPFVYFTSSCYAALSATEAIRTVFQPDEHIGINRVVVEGLYTDVCKKTEQDTAMPQAGVTLKRQTNDLFTVSVEVNRPGFLVVSQNALPGWSASEDGKEIPILVANGIFQALYLTPGDHTVQLAYRPVSFIAGLVLGCVGFALLLVLSSYFWYTKRILK